jgi:hypothetical protein
MAPMLPRLLALVLAAWSCAVAASADERYSVTTYAVEIAGGVEQVDVYRPTATAQEGVAVVAHGFARSRARHRDLGRALAEATATRSRASCRTSRAARCRRSR